MIKFTKEEKTVLLFVLAALFVGTAVLYYKKLHPRPYRAVEFDEKKILKPKKTSPAPRRRGPVNINEATKEELMSIKNIGPVLAGRIIVYREKYGLFIVFPLFGSLSMISIDISQLVFMKWKRKRKYKNRLKYLYQLTIQEKNILSGYIDDDTKTQELSIMSGVVKGLEYAGVIYRSTDLGSAAGASFDYNIQPWAWHYLKDNLELLNE